MKESNPEVKKALLKAIKNQIKENNPPETKQTYERLLSENISKENVYIYLGQALVSELYAMMKEKRLYDRGNYAKLLARLPNLIDE